MSTQRPQHPIGLQKKQWVYDGRRASEITQFTRLSFCRRRQDVLRCHWSLSNRVRSDYSRSVKLANASIVLDDDRAASWLWFENIVSLRFEPSFVPKTTASNFRSVLLRQQQYTTIVYPAQFQGRGEGSTTTTSTSTLCMPRCLLSMLFPVLLFTVWSFRRITSHCTGRIDYLIDSKNSQHDYDNK